MTKIESDKLRFDYLRKVTKGRSRRLSCPQSGKNRNQRARLSSAFSGFRPQSTPSFCL